MFLSECTIVNAFKNKHFANYCFAKYNNTSPSPLDLHITTTTNLKILQVAPKEGINYNRKPLL